MVRPAKPEASRRVRGTGIRFTADERASVLAKAAASGLTLSAFVRRAAMGLAVTKRPANTDHGAIPFALANELRRVGVNLNQIARLSHMGIEHEAVLLGLLDEIRAILDRIYDEIPAARKMREKG